MKPHPKRKFLHKRKVIPAMIAACGLAASLTGQGLAELADLADVPLANSPSDAVLPNLMYILDDSGSMAWDYMPDNVHNGPGAGGGTMYNCKQLVNCGSGATSCSVGISSSSSPGTTCKGGGNISDWGEPPYYSSQFNQIYYNPDVYYAPAVDATGTSLGDINPASAYRDYYEDRSVANRRNLATQYPDVYYCTVTSPTSAQLANTTVCRRNGVDNIAASPNNYFLYWSNNLSTAGPRGALPSGSSSGNAFRFRVVGSGNAHYYRITPHEYCSDENLINCALANANGTAPAGFPIPAPLRYCSGTANAISTSAVSDPASSTTPKCQKNFTVGKYIYPRYGRFTRVDITSSVNAYAKSATAIRPDCGAGATCTYAQEMQNFANWYSYYRTRLSMMKTATGRSFRTIDDRYRVGFITINPGSPVTATRYLPIDTFGATQKENFYDKLYGIGTTGSTPLREALSRIGRHYAGVTTGINNGMSQDPMTHSCQQNFALLTSDGYWNDSGTVAITTSGAAVGNQDNVPTVGTPVYVSRPTATLDGTGALQTTSTPSIEREQVICSGNSTISWTTGGTGSQTTSCGCTGTNKRVWERRREQAYNVTLTDGVQTSATTNVSSVSFTAITACTPPHIQVTSTRYTETQEQVLNSRSATTTFGSLVTGAPVGSQETGACNSNKFRSVVRRVRVLERIETVTDGVTASTFSVASQTFTVRTMTNTSGTNGATCTSGSLTAAASSLTVTSGPSTSSNGGTTLVTTLTPTNPLTVPNGAATTTTTFAGSPNTLADVAMYYYKTDLRTSGALAPNNVPTSDKDVAPHQHMVTFTLGLGLKGFMEYRSDYESATTGDFAKIRNADTTCSWLPGGQTCNWPVPSSNSPSTLDDLWHAAVNGRGTFYSAADPNSLADGLSGALSSLKIQTAAASASATSSPNITETDNFIYSSTFRTVKWDGQITAQRIDTNTGNVLPAVVWEAQALLDARVSSTSDTRSLFKFDSANTGSTNTNLRPFLWANLSGNASSSACTIATERGCFQNKGINLSQYAFPLNSTQQGLADNGENMVNWLRGQTRWEGADDPAERVFRDREHILGDPVNATPAYVRAPVFNFLDDVSPSYATFKANNAGRQGVLYIAANDGMLHAFNGEDTPNAVAPSAPAATGGRELWGYVPRITFPEMHRLATVSWDQHHKYLVDGSPQVMDAFQTTTPATTSTVATGAWKTILVGGLNKGGRGFYALDVTDPNNPKGLWEICADSNLCAISDPDIGLSYGNAVITKRAFDGRWIVAITSGINNVTPGTGRGYLFILDAFTGQILRKVDTGAGDTTTPAGLSKISAFAENFNNDNTATWIYGGDLLGNLWRFDLSVDPPVAFKLAELKDGTNKPQSITSRPELGIVDGKRAVFVGTGRYLGTDDLVDPATLSLPWAYQQSFYAIKDDFPAGASAGYGNIRSLPLPGGLIEQTLIDNETTRTTSNNAVNWGTNLGWYVDLNPGNTSPGERINLDPQLILGTVVVVSNVPNNNACTVGGDSFIYQFNYATGSYVASAPGQQVAQKFTGQITVGLVVVRLPSGVFKGVATGATGTKTPVGVNIGGAGGSGRRVSWRELVR